ncbi:hypothetical protein GCM10011414_12520 [Croceivirga lutea]|nr:hypothetical protein GCM10011414_12520 [Croceivirga lutea]
MINLGQKFYYLKHIFIFPLVILLIGTSCQSPPERNCTNFKEGTFSFSEIIDGDTLTTKFIRKDGIEIDFFNGNRDTSAVRWINDCEYILKKKNPNSKAEERPIQIKILTTTDSSYTFEYNIVGEPKKLRGTAIKTN